MVMCPYQNVYQSMCSLVAWRGSGKYEENTSSLPSPATEQRSNSFLSPTSHKKVGSEVQLTRESENKTDGVLENSMAIQASLAVLLGTSSSSKRGGLGRTFPYANDT